MVAQKFAYPDASTGKCHAITKRYGVLYNHLNFKQLKGENTDSVIEFFRREDLEAAISGSKSEDNELVNEHEDWLNLSLTITIHREGKTGDYPK